MENEDCIDDNRASAEEEEHNQNDESRTSKLFPDYSVAFGDGEANLDFPVYSMETLNVADEGALRTRLARQLRSVSELRQDVQPNGVVHDIVDPSLHANILSEEEISEEISVPGFMF